MVYFMENPFKMDNLGVFPVFLEKHPYLPTLIPYELTIHAGKLYHSHGIMEHSHGQDVDSTT